MGHTGFPLQRNVSRGRAINVAVSCKTQFYSMAERALHSSTHVGSTLTDCTKYGRQLGVLTRANIGTKFLGATNNFNLTMVFWGLFRHCTVGDFSA